MTIEAHTFSMKIGKTDKPFSTVCISTIEKDEDGLDGITLRSRPEGSIIVICKFQPPQSVRFQYETFFILKDDLTSFKEYCENQSLEIVHIYE